MKTHPAMGKLESDQNMICLTRAGLGNLYEIARPGPQVASLEPAIEQLNTAVLLQAAGGDGARQEYDDLQGLPPLWLTVGTDEGLLDDSLRFAEKAKAAGVDTRLIVGEAQGHCYPCCPISS